MKPILYEAVEAEDCWDFAATVAVPASSMNNAAPSMTFVKRWRMNASSWCDGKPDTRFRCLLIRRAQPEVKPSTRLPELPSTPDARTSQRRRLGSIVRPGRDPERPTPIPAGPFSGRQVG